MSFIHAYTIDIVSMNTWKEKEAKW